jgi:DNA-binding MarR family transcriptional regulator
MPQTSNEQHASIEAQIAGSCLAGRVRLVSRAITGLYDDALRPLGMTTGQLNTLVFIARRGPIRPGVIAASLSMDKSTLSRNLERMRQHGWITTEKTGAGNTQTIKIATRGRAMIRKAHPRWLEAQRKCEQLLGTMGVKAVHKASDSIKQKF